MKMRSLAALAALAVAACTQTPPAPTIMVKPLDVAPPAECLAADDPPFPTLPDRDVDPAEAARDREAGKAAYEELRARRAVCRQGLVAGQVPAGSTARGK